MRHYRQTRKTEKRINIHNDAQKRIQYFYSNTIKFKKVLKPVYIQDQTIELDELSHKQEGHLGLPRRMFQK